MTTSRVRRRADAAPARWRKSEATAIAVAAVLALVHDLDERVVRPAAGEDRGGQLWHAGASVALVALILLATRVVPPAAAAPLLAGVGAVALGDGATHVVHLAGGQADASDATAVPAAGGAAVLLLLAAVGAFRRAERARGPGRRWADRAATLLVVLGVTTYVLVPVVVGTVQVHLPRRPVSPPPSVGFAAVTLRTDDGVGLRGWYRPSRNGAAVMMLNSARGDHRGSDAHARLLADHGYGVLVYDARGTGGSEGSPNGWGWTWLPDVSAGVNYLLGRPDVAHRSVGLFGLSTGADVAIQAAAQDARIRAVVADGATAQSFSDRPEGLWSALSLWPTFTTARLLTSRSAPEPLADAIAAIGRRPVLLVAAGSISQEIPLNEGYDATGGGAVTLWKLPHERHISGLSSRPEQYAARVLGHLDEALLQASATGSPRAATAVRAPRRW